MQENFLQILVARRIADHDFEVSRLDNIFHIDIVKRELLARKDVRPDCVLSLRTYEHSKRPD